MRRLVVVLVGVLALSACGGDDGGAPSPEDPYGYGTLDDGRLSFCADPENADDDDCATPTTAP